jgi:hypothetical protein
MDSVVLVVFLVLAWFYTQETVDDEERPTRDSRRPRPTDPTPTPAPARPRSRRRRRD